MGQITMSYRARRASVSIVICPIGKKLAYAKACQRIDTLLRRYDIRWQALSDYNGTNNNVIPTEGRESIVICPIGKKTYFSKSCQRIDTLLRRYDIRWQAFVADR